jgi:hypothetical protein
MLFDCATLAQPKGPLHASGDRGDRGLPREPELFDYDYVSGSRFSLIKSEGLNQSSRRR